MSATYLTHSIAITTSLPRHRRVKSCSPNTPRKPLSASWTGRLHILPKKHVTPYSRHLIPFALPS
ncbi:unnamed protein product [Periconia digitata]|uniref:Uncharacterized protein n=1 Tax=Periconia digitata TaxID=1303443 RepID=A0A9W4UQW6_9PLEO|nr:unnamed protein product [Periconia digitata]